MEVFPQPHRLEACRKRLLHVRGGVAFWRRCGLCLWCVFSTSVEVFLPKSRSKGTVPCLLHVRGGVSLGNFEVGATTGSSPRPWRCFCGPLPYAKSAQVFSTSVEVFLQPSLQYTHELSLLHIRGGVSRSASGLPAVMMSSPRPWRCFLVGRHLRKVDSSLLHVRGGVSEVKGEPDQGSLSSPRPWRCFSIASSQVKALQVFSTSVEVFPTALTLGASFAGLLHVRGGVSKKRHVIFAGQRSSPRPWRCF